MAEDCDAVTELPREVVCDILQRVHRDCSNEVILCMEVSKEWHEAVQATASTLKVARSTRLWDVLQRIARFENLQTLWIDAHDWSGSSDVWAPAFEKLGMSCPRLEALHIIQSNNQLQLTLPLSTEDAAVLFHHCSSIRTFELCCNVSTKLPPLTPLTALESLTLSGPLNVPPLDTLTGLTTLALKNIRLLPFLPCISALAHLHTIDLTSCYRIPRLPPLGGSPLLQHLNVSLCLSLLEIDINPVPQLISLNVSDCKNLSQILGIENHCSLKAFSALRCRRLRPWPDLSRVERLEDVAIDEASSTEIDHLMSASQLRCLELSVSYGRGSFGSFPELQELTLSNHFEGSLPDLAALRNLRRLKLNNCSCVGYLDEMENLSCLEDVEIMGCRMLSALPELSSFPHLQSLVIRELILIQELPHLDNAVNLTRLECAICPKLRELPPLRGTPHLRVMKLQRCPLVCSLPPIAQLEALTHLDFSGCTSLCLLPSLPRNLRSLNLEHCHSLVNLPPLDSLALLEELLLDYCTSVLEVPLLSGLMSLRKLSLASCEGITALPPLSALLSLRLLDISGCIRLVHVPPLRDLKRLREVRIGRCQAELGYLEGVHEYVEIVKDYRCSFTW